MKTAAIVSVTLMLGNYAYQFFGAQDWDTAFERSYFQFAACVVMGLVAMRNTEI